jgi:hypothetical protein
MARLAYAEAWPQKVENVRLGASRDKADEFLTNQNTLIANQNAFITTSAITSTKSSKAFA